MPTRRGRWVDPLAATAPKPAWRRPTATQTPAPRPARQQLSATARGLGVDHQREREQLLIAHRDGTPCPCLTLNDCGPACPCRPVGSGLPMYRTAARNVDGRPLEADHSRARNRGGSRADRLLLSVCNRSRGDGTRSGRWSTTTRPASPDRLVVLLCGPAGAGKTTAAREGAQRLGLQVFDRDDPQWSSERAFTTALADLARDPDARAVVIRAGSTSSARATAARLVDATHTYLLLASREELGHRVARRARHDVEAGLASIGTWLARFDDEDQVQRWPGWDGVPTTASTTTAVPRRRAPVLARSRTW